ncbi:hypothetical protein C8J38_11144 [Rhizobium sp. PP-WC-2G-219]|uniref:hypothetical protein n=1 Tax=Rhizobium sp. PP-CC-3G-465 TaxID=2135648 RepID=UPI000D8ACC1C|nr:hypothetical protein C8J37_13310 [Rhizobium sp. PP-WC-1G-195]PYE40484.1 hypothetical protein DFI02_11647 [Rhizobium sp. PP-F2F-G20b]TCL89677.1 hypothetical protein C8J38_11144 [Rhizobium sp. PP-WC-2G-219]TCQ14810.1 hypothetical protein C8J33_12310 [Rhizobium sp. PP-CC-3G-465]
MKHFAALLATGLIFFPLTSYAANNTPGQGGAGGAGGQNGGNGGIGNGHNGGDGTSTMPGCGGGTDPSPDDKFYIPGTKQECNPSDDDRQKLK